ncbi:MAG: hypothetical protein LBT90_03275 [Holosporaceae bacterium]|nr:hypothetical protein [Holosporaceae bacterium]
MLREINNEEWYDYTKSHHRLTIARLAAAAIERVLEAIWTIQNEIWYYMFRLCCIERPFTYSLTSSVS